MKSKNEMMHILESWWLEGMWYGRPTVAIYAMSMVDDMPREVEAEYRRLLTLQATYELYGQLWSALHGLTQAPAEPSAAAGADRKTDHHAIVALTNQMRDLQREIDEAKIDWALLLRFFRSVLHD